MRFLENRIPPPVVMLIFGTGMYGLSYTFSTISSSDAIKYSLAACFVVFGAAMLSAGAISFRLAKTTVNPLNPEKASSLVTSGIYRITRNPMYVGFASLLLAWACYLESLWSLILVAAYVLYIQRFQIVPEERALLKIFGGEFEEYRLKVRAWL